MLAPGLSVAIDDGSTCRNVTRYCSGLRFTKVAPGGHQQMQVQMLLPHGTFTALGPNDRITVSDQRTAQIVFDGYIKNPTPIDGPFGQFYALSALGGMWRAASESRPLVYATRDLGDFEAGFDRADGSGTDTGKWVQDETLNRVRVEFPAGSLAATDALAPASNDVYLRAGMTLGAIRVLQYLSGKDDAGWLSEFYVTPPNSPVTSLYMTDDDGYFLETFAGDGTLPTDVHTFGFRIRRVGAPTNVADELTWTDWVEYASIGHRVDRYGVPLAHDAMGEADTVLASAVVEDLLGRLLTMCDPDVAVVEPTEFPIDQLAYPDGARALDVLSHLTVWEYDHVWEIGERLPSGLHRFGWRAWPAAPRYVVSTTDGWVERGSDADVCNRVLVTWTDALGVQQSLAVTAADLLADGLVTAADLDGVGDGLTAGQIRDAEQFSLGDGKGSAVNAARIGRGLLLDSIKPPRAGQVTVRGKVVDLLTGCTVMPWELEPGYVCRVREKGYDLRVTQADYDHDAQEMVLTLGTPVLTNDQRLAKLAAA